jgi:fructose-bisphosphate aldolase class II
MNDAYLEVYKMARRKGFALGAFNVFNGLTAEAVVQAANEMQRPLVMEMSTSVVKKLGVERATALLFDSASRADQPMIIHLDHCTEPEIAKACIDAGWQSIMFDGSKLSLEDNIQATKELVAYARDKDVLFEGEVGVIVGTEDDLVSKVSRLASFDETLHYMDSTGIDMIAPAIGTAHGLYRGKPKINFELVEKLTALDRCPVVVHGGTGLAEEEFRRLVALGAAKINVSTAIKHAYLDAMKAMVCREKMAYNPVAVDAEILQAVKATVIKHMQMFEA